MTHRPRLFLAAAALVLAACSGGSPPSALDPARARLLGALPPEETARGVYVVDLKAAGDLSPGSLLAPIVAPLADDAELLVETAAPPVTLLGGVDSAVETPAGATRVDDVLVIGPLALRDAVAGRLREAEQPEGIVAELAGSSAPVGWAGPTPAPDGSGTTIVTLSRETVRFAVTPQAPPGAAEESARRELAEGGPPGSPGKPWKLILRDARVTRADGRLIVEAVATDLPGLFFRVLIDQRQMTFLAG